MVVPAPGIPEQLQPQKLLGGLRQDLGTRLAAEPVPLDGDGHRGLPWAIKLL